MSKRNDGPDGADGSEPVGDRVRIYRRGRTWYANFQDGRKQHRESLKTTSKKEARRLALRIEVDLAEGKWKETPKAVPVAEASDSYRDYLATEGRAAKTKGKYNAVLGHVIALADKRKVRDIAGINLSFVDAYRAMRVKKGIAPKTLYTESVVIRQLVNFALSRGMLADDPLKELKLKKPKPTKQPCWTRDEVLRILEASPADVRPALVLLAETGMRFGEMAWRTWADIDRKSNVLHVRPKDDWKPKTGDQRSVPISTVLAALLTALPTTWRWVVTMPPSPTHRADGRQWTERRLLAALKRVLKGLGLEGKLHTFRHSFISHALLQNTPVSVVKEWVGHVDDAVIKLYTHVHDDASQAAMQRLSKADRSLHAEGTSNGDPEEDGSAQTQHSDKE